MKSEQQAVGKPPDAGRLCGGCQTLRPLCCNRSKEADTLRSAAAPAPNSMATSHAAPSRTRYSRRTGSCSLSVASAQAVLDRFWGLKSGSRRIACPTSAWQEGRGAAHQGGGLINAAGHACLAAWLQN